MRILGDSQITNATVTATNILSAALTDKLQTFQLTDNMRTLSNSTIIDIDFGTTISPVDAVALCGSSLSSNAVITLSYSDTNILTPDASIVLPLFSTLHQVFYLDSELEKRYWRISVTDASLSTFSIGYIYIGKYFQVPFVAYGHEPSFDIFSNSTITPTGQGYGSKIYNALPIRFIMYMDYSDLETYFNILETKQNIDPVLIVMYDESYDMDLYRPRYGVLSNTSTPFPTSEINYTYQISGTLRETF